MSDARHPVWVASRGAALQAGIISALGELGWPAERLSRVPRWAGRRQVLPGGAQLVVVADDRGGLPDLPQVLPAQARPLVAVGPLSALGALASAVEAGGVTAVRLDQPFGDLIGRLDQVLRAGTCPARSARSRLAALLREREREARRFAALTSRELDVLSAMTDGCSAADIAARQQVAVATVRSHIRGILTKLGVSSQLAAVALAHRSGPEPTVAARIRRSQQFW